MEPLSPFLPFGLGQYQLASEIMISSSTSVQGHRQCSNSVVNSPGVIINLKGNSGSRMGHVLGSLMFLSPSGLSGEATGCGQSPQAALCFTLMPGSGRWGTDLNLMSSSVSGDHDGAERSVVTHSDHLTHTSTLCLSPMRASTQA